MPRERNLKNLKTEKEGIQILKEKISNFHTPNSEERKYIYKVLDIDYRKYSRSVDGIILNVPGISDIRTERDVTLVEIKTTKARYVEENCHMVPFLVLRKMKKIYLRQNQTIGFVLYIQ